MNRETKILLTLFAVFITLQAFDFITTNLAFDAGLGTYELNPIAMVLAGYNLLWLGKIIMIGVMGVISYWLWKKAETKTAIRGIYIVNSLCVSIVVINLLSLGMVM